MIYTFYSFKGGVGRSMALANVAEYYRRKGLKVIMVDWDLEAPGLENYFYEEKELEAIRAKPGLLDLLLTYQRDFPELEAIRGSGVKSRPGSSDLPAGNTEDSGKQDQAPDWASLLDQYLSPISTFLQPITAAPGGGGSAKGNASGQENGGGSLSLLSAGWRAGERFPGYAQDVQAFDWSEFFARFQGEAFFDWMRRQFERESADIVLIDSRTGVTEMGGVCTRYLADVVVAFCTPNFKTIESMLRITRSFRIEERPKLAKARQGRRVQTVVIPTRLELSELKMRDYFLAAFEKSADDLRPTELAKRQISFCSLGVPYASYYTYQETLALDGPGPEIGAAYRKLAIHLALLFRRDSRVRECLSDDLQESFRDSLPRVYLSWRRESETPPAVKELGARLREQRLWESDDESEAPYSEQRARRLIAQCESMVLVLSPGVFSSAWVAKDCEFARLNGLRIVPVALPDFSDEELSEAPTWMVAQRVVQFPKDWEQIARILQQSPARSLKVPAMAPAPQKHWIGRAAERRQLASALLAGGPPRVILSGANGTGKTTTAAEFCHDPETTRHFVDGVLWASLQPVVPTSETATRAETAVTPGLAPAVLKELTNLYVALTGEQPPVDNVQALSDALGEKLAGLRCLLVLDSVEGLVGLAPFLQAGRDCAILILTRNANLAVDFPVTRIELGPLETDEAVAMLGAFLSEEQREPEALRRLAEGLEPRADLVREAGDELRRRLQQTQETVQAAVEAILGSRGTKKIEESLAKLNEKEREALQMLARQPADVPMTIPRFAELLPSGSSISPSDFLLRLASLQIIQLNANSGVLTLERSVREYLMKAAPANATAARTSESGGVQAPPVAREQAEQCIEEAHRILRGEKKTPGELLERATKLKGFNEFGLARKLLARARQQAGGGAEAKLRLKLIQQHALCTYKDPDLPLTERLDRALKILSEVGPLSPLEKPKGSQDGPVPEELDQETLGIAGAIHKRKWEANGQRQHLEQGLGYYLRGHRHPHGLAGDYGYTSINAAFILDCLAAQEEAAAKATGIPSSTAESRRAEAAGIRRQILSTLPGLLGQKGNEWLGMQWWFFVTVAEAAFGLRDYDAASLWLTKARQVPVLDWEYESTTRQLAALARMHAGDDDSFTSPAWKTIQRFVGSEVAAESKFVGKIGLALSGGGFRASLFHIGVLARLAELDLLRSVEVLSCVSGGSIIGAHYYLELRQLLQTKADTDITSADYMAIVQKITHDFLSGVQRNIRTRVAAEFMTNLRMLLDSGYSRTQRAGELYEEEIFSKVRDGEGDKPRYINNLIIRPKDAPVGFKPKYDNWRRRAKVPILILNATTLNTGHTWQFTASFMGESPYAIDTRVDGNDRLRRMYYEQLPGPEKRMRLGHAVAASSCVPGLFEPLELANLYPEMTVRLVDGGVHDNQGVASLLEQDANFLIVSDASGQMGLQKEPSKGTLGVPLRANDILMARVREAQFQDLRGRYAGALLRGFHFVHLKRDLEVDPVDWKECADPYDASDEARPPEQRGPLTSYGIRKDVQERLAALRTDLDSFSEVEAYALMTSGYLMIKSEFAGSDAKLHRVPTAPQAWAFQEVEKYANLSKGNEEGARTLLEFLGVGAQQAFKIWRLSRPLQLLSVILGVVVAAGFALAWWSMHGRTFYFPLSVDALSWALLLIVGGSVLGKTAMWILDSRNSLSRIVRAAGMSAAGFLLARLHLWVFDPLFLETGKVENLARRKPGRIGRTLGFILPLVAGVCISAIWLWFQSTAYDRRRIIADAPVVQTVETRGVGIPRAGAWAAALELAGEKQKADTAFQLVTQAAASLTNPDEKVNALIATADAFADAKRPDDAWKQLDLAQTALPSISDPATQSWARCKISPVLGKLGRTKEAQENMTQALAGIESTVQGDPVKTAKVARWLTKENQPDLAKVWANKALMEFDRSKPSIGTAIGLAQEFVDAGDKTLAQQVLRKVEATPLTTTLSPEEQQTLAKAWVDAGDFKRTPGIDLLSPESRALAWARAGKFDTALGLKGQINEADRPKVLTQIASDLVKVNQPERARGLLDEALATLSKDPDSIGSSATRAQIAKTLADTGAVNNAADVAAQIPLAADRLDAYTVILNAIQNKSRKAQSSDRGTPTASPASIPGPPAGS